MTPAPHLGALELASVLCLPWFLGAGVLRALGLSPRADWLAFPGWAQLVGLLATSLVVFAFALVGAPLEARLLAPAVLVLAIAAHALAAPALTGRAGAAARELARSPASVGERWVAAARGERLVFWAALALCLLFSADVLLRSTGVAVANGDEAFLWASRAKVLYTVGEFGPALARETLDRAYVQHADYPPLNPLVQVWVFAHAGGIVDVAGRYPLQLLSPALILILAAALRRRARPLVAAGLLLLVVGQKLFLHLSSFIWSDLALAVAVLVVVDAWLRREEEPDRRWEPLMGLGLAAMVWTKNEGVMIALVFAAAAAVAGLVRVGANRVPAAGSVPSPRRAALWTLPAIVLLGVHRLFNQVHGFTNDLAGADKSGDGPLGRFFGHFAERFGLVFEFHLREVWFSPENSRLIPGVALALALLFPLRVLRGRRLAPGLGLLGVLLLYPLVFIGTVTPYVEWHLGTAADRVAWHLVPALALWLALVVSPRLTARGDPG